MIYSSISAYCMTALRYSNLDDRNPLTGYGCFGDHGLSYTRTYYVNTGRATSNLPSISTSASYTSTASPGSSLPGSSLPTNATLSATTSQTTTQSTSPKQTVSDSDSLQEKSNTIALAVGLSVGLTSLILSAIGVWFAYRAHKLDRLRPVIESLSKSFPFNRNISI
jgi:hypothetical protein